MVIKIMVIKINIVIMSQQEDEVEHERKEEIMHMKGVKYLKNCVLKF